MTTYGDLVTLLLTFFVLLMNPKAIDGARLELIMLEVNGLGPLRGGNTLEKGKLAELGNRLQSMPSNKQAQALNRSQKTILSVVQSKLKDTKLRVREDTRGIVISLASDTFFKPASDRVNIESARRTLEKLGNLLVSPQLKDKKIRIEGHTDSVPTDPEGPWPTNWELSADRAANVLHYLTDFGVNDRNFQIAGLADTAPVDTAGTPEAAGENRRVDIVILDKGHL